MTKATKKTAFKGPKRGRASSDADVDDGTNRPWKHSKTGHLMLPVEDGGKGSSRSRTAPPSHLLPACINPAVNPMGPDKRQARTSAEVTATTGRKKKLRAKLEKIEKKKALILAEIQAAEEEEEQEEKRAIRDVTGLAKSPPSANQLGVDGTNNNDLADGNAYSKGARKHKTLKNEFILEDDDDSDFILFIPGYNRARAELESRKVLVWDSDPDFIEYCTEV